MGQVGRVWVRILGGTVCAGILHRIYVQSRWAPQMALSWCKTGPFDDMMQWYLHIMSHLVINRKHLPPHPTDSIYTFWHNDMSDFHLFCKGFTAKLHLKTVFFRWGLPRKRHTPTQASASLTRGKTSPLWRKTQLTFAASCPALPVIRTRKGAHWLGKQPCSLSWGNASYDVKHALAFVVSQPSCLT